MARKKVLKTGSIDQGIPGVPLDQGARLDGPRSGHEFEGHLKRDVEEAKAESVRIGWQKLANGLTIPANLVPAICTHCGMWIWVKPEDVFGNCQCYHPDDRTDSNLEPNAPAWKRRPATKAELAAWSKRQVEIRARYEAEAPLRRAALDAFNRRLRQDDPTTGKSFVNDPTRSVGRA